MATRTKRPKPPKAPRSRKPPKPKKLPVGHFQEAGLTPRGAQVGHQSTSHVLHATDGSPALDLLAGVGLSGVILELVGEGHLGLGHALAAFQREQDRVANRAWRRPGGMVRMGGL